MGYKLRVKYGSNVILDTPIDTVDSLTKTLPIKDTLVNSNLNLEIYKTALPGDYTQLEYIKSTRTQWMDLGSPATANTRLEISIIFSGTFTPGSSKTTIFSAGNGTTNGRFTSNFGEGASGEYADIHNWHRNSYNGYQIYLLKTNSETLTNRNWLIADRKNSTMTHGSISVNTETGTKVNSPRNIYLFNDTYVFSAYDCYLYEIRLYEDNVLIKDFIPCKNPSAIPGMYDIIGEKFYSSSSSTQFVAGPVV